MISSIKRVATRIYTAFNEFQNDDGFLMAAAVSYYVALAFFPLLLILFSGLGFVMRYTGWGRDAQQRVLDFIAEQTSPDMAQQVGEALREVETQALISGPIGIGALLLTAMAIFVNFEYAFDRIWNREQPESQGILGVIKSVLFDRFKAFLMLLALGALILITFVAGLVLSAMLSMAGEVAGGYAPIWQWSEVLLTVVLNTFLFTAIFRWLPKVPVSWAHAAQGGVLTAVTWEIGRQILSAFVITDQYTAYGVIGALIAIMLWSYYAMTVLFVGAEYVQVVRADAEKDAQPDAAERSAS